MAKIEEELNMEFVHERHRAVASIVFTGSWITNRMADVLKPHKISSPQFNILRILRGAGEWLSMNTVRDRMVEKSPNATRLCDKLENKKLIVRKRGVEDRRVVYLHITEEGLKLLEEIGDQEGDERMNFIENISEEEAAIISNLLDKLRS